MVRSIKYKSIKSEFKKPLQLSSTTMFSITDLRVSTRKSTLYYKYNNRKEGGNINVQWSYNIMEFISKRRSIVCLSWEFISLAFSRVE